MFIIIIIIIFLMFATFLKKKRSVLLIHKDEFATSVSSLLKKASFVYVSSVTFQKMPPRKTKFFAYIFTQKHSKILKNKHRVIFTL